MTTMLHQQEAVMPRTRHLRKFWAATFLTVLAAMAIAAVVAMTAGSKAGKIVLITAILVSSVVALSDSVVAVRRRNRSRR